MTSVALPGAISTRHTPWWWRVLMRNAWVLGVWLLLGILIFWYANLIPNFGSFQIASISKNSLPLVYLAIGQAIIVIAGGIDLSLGPLLLLSNVLAARFMHEQPLPLCCSSPLLSSSVSASSKPLQAISSTSPVCRILL
jgi:ribose/xylose/arabinose/galactoside ABC-type transport system permease subunit